MSKDILESKLLEPGAGFIVTDAVKDGTFSPGSMGFISFVRGLDESYQNLAKVLVIIIRRGKSGKPRIMHSTLSVPIFDVDHDGFRRLMPEEGTRKYYVNIRREIPVATDIMELTPLEFLGYAVAMSKRVKHLSDQCKHRRWPESKSHPVNILKKLPDNFEGHPDVYLEKYTGSDFRQNFIADMRRMSSAMIRVHLELDITRASAELNAAEFLLFSNEGEFIPKDAEDKTNKYRFTEDKKLLQNTTTFHLQLKKEIEKLYKNKRKKS